MPTSPGKMESDEVICVNGRGTGLTVSVSTQRRAAKKMTTAAAIAAPAIRRGILFNQDGVPVAASISILEGESASVETPATGLAAESLVAKSSSCTGAMNRYPRFAT